MSGRIIKVKQVTEYVQIPNSIAQSPGLSAKEKGVLLCLMSFPEDWKVYKTTLHNYFEDKRDGIMAAFNGLIEKGFIKQVRHHDDLGQFVGYDYTVSCHPFPENPLTAKPETEKPLTENPSLQINNPQKRTVQKRTIQSEASELEVWPTFEDFWSLGLPKADKERAERYWKKISQAEREQIMIHAPQYIDSVDDKRFIKQAPTYLNQKAWKNEIIDRRNATAIVSGSIAKAGNSITAEGTLERLGSYRD